MLAEKQGARTPLMIGHRLVGGSLVFSGDIQKGRAHLDSAIALYEPGEHRPLATRFGLDIKVAILNYRSLATWAMGFPQRALADTEHALKTGREIDQAPTLMNALPFAGMVHLLCGSHAIASALADELVAVAELKGALLWQACGMLVKGAIFGATGRLTESLQMISSGIAAYRSTGATVTVPLYLVLLAAAQAELGQFDDAWLSIEEAMTAVETSGERWFEAEVQRIAGEIALKSPEADAAKAQAYFERALSIAREQQAKSWELRTAMSMARLWRDENKRCAAHELLGPIYGRFTEGFDTLDLKTARAVLDELTG
jgi:predicted ATPase